LKEGLSDQRGNIGTVSVFQTVPTSTHRRMLRHTTHLATSLRPVTRRKKARHSAAEVVRDSRQAVAAHAAPGPDAGQIARMHADAVMYPARERAAGGPQDRALYSCGCGYAFLASVEAGVHCPHCSAEQSW
jgi:hypothetical protein